MVANFLLHTQNSCFPYSYASIDTKFHSSLFAANASFKGYTAPAPSYNSLIHRFACGGFAIHDTISAVDFVVENSVLLSIISGLLILLVLYACYGIWKHRQMQNDSKDPKTWPILGSQLEAARNYDRLIDWITSYFRDDHRTVKMSFLSRHSYLTVDPANVEHILKTNFHNYPKGEESHHRLFDLLGNGILNTDGSMWKTHRKLGSFEFSVKKLRHLSSTVYKSSALSLLQMLEKSSQAVDMQELLLNMTFNSICEVVFGNDVKISVGGDAAIAKALDNVQEMITRRYVFPWWRLQKLLNIGSERLLHQDITRFNNFLTQVIHHKRSQMHECATALKARKVVRDVDNGEGAAGEDLLSRFILHQEAVAMSVTSASCTSCTGRKNVGDTSKDRDENVNVEKKVREAMMSFVMAGRDTTASTLSWFLYCMCTHPHMQEEVFQELIKLENNYSTSNNIMECDIDSRLGVINEDRTRCSMKSRVDHMKEFAEKVLSYEALQSSSTPYLHAALAETLRLYPAVPRDGKVALRDDVLPDGTHLKAGDQVAYIPYAMGRMPFLWGHDATLFRPQRWLANGTFQPQSPFKFTAFQAGPRMCLGKDAAYLQMKITVALLLRFFHFKLVPNHPIEYRMMMVMTMKHGLKVHVTPRSINL